MLANKLAAVKVREAGEAGGLQVFGLFWEVPSQDYLTLDEGVTQGLLEVTEVNQGGNVPTLHVHNKAERPAFLMQARCLSEEWGCPWTAEPRHHHFSVIDGLKDPASPLCNVLLDGV